ncbi:sensor histidine kinase [Polyangium aurulentum]|uniref:sensor histidine kinase n=1 Tax=Polyangium aurulentum TaxID=2567896 RepID=UPI00146F2CC8|nr:ATP-binding protein [Polyangium aurulentum]UQA58649.1 response regulator [Polyangium aurulentum]
MSEGTGEARDGEKPSRILVVANDEPTRAALRETLEAEGHEVILAKDSDAALDHAAAGDVDLVLLDLLVPGTDGIEVCRAIRNELKLPDLPVVFVTTLQDRETRIRGKAAGCDDFLGKPVDPLELAARVEVLLKVKAYHDLVAAQRRLAEEELEKTRARLLQADRLATLGTIAAGVGHELNNVASVLTHTASFIRAHAAEGKPPEPDDLVALERGAAHLAEHAKNLLHLGSPGHDHIEVLDMMAVVSDVLAMLNVAGRTKRVNVMTSGPTEPVKVAFSRTKLEQILVNLLTNAADAVMDQPPEYRIIRIEVSADEDQKRASCLVEDAGCGIPADHLSRVFDAYYTTKPPGKGTGLGLAVVKSLIEDAGGKIAVESEIGKGTAVRFDLPLAPPSC